MIALFLAAALLVPGAEKTVTTGSQLRGAPGYQVDTSIASNGSEFVVTWTANFHGFAARLSRTGQLVDPVGVPLALTAIPTQFSRLMFAQGGPMVAGVGDHFIVIGWDGTEIRAERLNADLSISSSHALGFFGEPLDVAIEGDAQTAFVVLDVDGRVYGRLLDSDAAPSGDWIALGSVDDPAHMALIRDATSYLLLIAKPWEGNLYGRRIMPDGRLLDWKKIDGLDVTDLDVLRAGRAGSQEVVAWHALHAKDLNVAAIDPGTLTSPRRYFVALPATVGVIFGHEGIATVVYTDVSTISYVGRAKTIDLASGNVVADAVMPATFAERSAAATIGDTDAVATFTANDADLDVAAQLFAKGIASGSPFTVSRAMNEQTAPHVAFGMSDGLVVWNEAGAGPRAVRVTSDGTPLDAHAIDVGAGGDANVAFDGQRFVVVWQSDSGVRARRYDENGLAVDAQPIVIDPNSKGTPAIACGPDDCLVAWLCQNGQTCSATLMHDGTSGAIVQLANDQGGGSADKRPDVAYGGGRFAVTWVTTQNSGAATPFYSGDSVVFVAPNGAPTGRIWLRDLVAGQPVVGTPKVAWNGSEFLAAWMMGGSLFVKSFTPDGATLLPPQSVPAPDPNAAVTDVSFVNGSWVIALNVTSAAGTFPPRSYLVELSPSLAFEAQITLTGDVSGPALPSDGTPLVVYSRIAQELPYGGAYRVFARPLVEGSIRRRSAAHR